MGWLVSWVNVGTKTYLSSGFEGLGLELQTGTNLIQNPNKTHLNKGFCMVGSGVYPKGALDTDICNIGGRLVSPYLMVVGSLPYGVVFFSYTELYTIHILHNTQMVQPFLTWWYWLKLFRSKGPNGWKMVDCDRGEWPLSVTLREKWYRRVKLFCVL